ncbi:MAG: hypothetical protein ACKOOG_13185, partial [Actinomycetota bacterium]
VDGDRVVNVPPLHSVSADLESAESAVSTLAWLKAARMGWPAGEVVPASAECTAERVFGGEGSQDNNNDGDVLDFGGGTPDVPFTTLNIDLDGDSTTGETDVIGERIQVGAVAPNGSGAGRTYGLDFTRTPLGCLDLVRSSSAASSGAQRVQYDSWAFALDGTGWNYFPGNTHGVTALTQTQLGKIYTCASANVDNSSPADGDFTDVGDTAAGEPQFRYWGDLSGNPADTTPIKAYRVQKGSGTGDDVARTLMGLGGNTNIGDNCSASPKDANYPVVQEHDCKNVATLDKPDAICFYGYSRWRLQARGLEADKRNGARFGAFATGSNTPLLPTAATITEGAGRYEGSRLVYTLITMQESSTAGCAASQVKIASFRDAIDFTGVRPTTGVDVNCDGDTTDATDVPTSESAVPGFACKAGPAQKIIRTYGLVPLALGQTDASDANYGSSYCRHNKYTF